MRSDDFSDMINPLDSNDSTVADDDFSDMINPLSRTIEHDDFSDVENSLDVSQPSRVNQISETHREGAVPGTSVRRVESSPSNETLETDGIISASGKALQNVPERMQMSVAGLMQMFGEDLNSEKERYISDKARRLGISDGDFKLLAWAGEQGLVSKETSFKEALPDLKANVAKSLNENQLKQLSQAGLFNPEEISSYGLGLRKDAQSTLEPINTEEGSAAYYASAAIGSLAENDSYAGSININ